MSDDLRRPRGADVSQSGVDLQEPSRINLRYLSRRIQDKVPFILCCALLGLVLAILVDLMPRHYTAVSRIQVRPGSSSQYKVDPSALLSMSDDSSKLDTEVLILQSDTLLLDTAKTLNLQNNRNFTGKPDPDEDPNGPKAQEKLLLQLHKHISATRIPRSEIIQITCNTKSATLSADIVKTLVAEYIEQLFKSRFSSTQRTAKWLTSQLDDLKVQVESDQRNLVELQSRLGVVGLDQSHDIVVTELEDLTKAADEARVQRIIAEARFRILQNGDMNLLEGGQDILGRDSPSASQLSLLANLRNQKAQVEATYAGLSARFGAKYDEVQQAAAQLATLNHEIQQEQARVLNQAQQAYDQANNNEHNTVATLDNKKSQAFQKQSDMVRYQILLHDYESSRSLYEGLVQRLRQAGIVAGLDSSEVDVVDEARVPGTPSEMGRAVTIVLGLLLGLAVGFGGALILIQFDQRLHELSQIESEMGLPLLSVTTAADKGAAGLAETTHAGLLQTYVPDIFKKHPSSLFVESMWSLRASLLLSNPGRPPKTILFTSCNPGEGKSTIASGEACALALRDARVLLIDADMRRPTIMSRFGLKNTVGLTSILTGRARVEDAIQAVEGLPNLSVITSGPIPPSAAAILASDSMEKLMAAVMDRYDFVLIDSPPTLGIVDTSSLAQFAEVIVLVLSYTTLNKASVNRVRRTLGMVGRSITGIAVNFADPASFQDYGYGYGNYYAETVPASPSAGKGGSL